MHCSAQFSFTWSHLTIAYNQVDIFTLCTTVNVCIYVYMYTTVISYVMPVVNGNWSEWRLGPCSKTCGGGIQNYILEYVIIPNLHVEGKNVMSFCHINS